MARLAVVAVVVEVVVEMVVVVVMIKESYEFGGYRVMKRL